ncbi:MAG: hypothetical protein EOQ30_34970 [Mesorhizobium sp.]|nr:hypothetical protein EOA29_35675 [Mesorhizobium sp. M1E.F.Ca.ET.063.01.1.1]RWA76104.1 MAG: hypothetical protein EOQ30_34970 [Mesorhizobium sp.]TIS47443.1 MAG: hypothetical protein E5W96_23020 [Mesorhizobium sp.]
MPDRTEGALQKIGKVTLEIVKERTTPRAKVLPRNWVVERTFAWLGQGDGSREELRPMLIAILEGDIRRARGRVQPIAMSEIHHSNPEVPKSRRENL